MLRLGSPSPARSPGPGIRASGPGRAAGKFLLLIIVFSCAAVPPHAVDFLVGSAQSQEDTSGGDQADSAPDGSVSISWTYSRTVTQCPPLYPCTDESTEETFSGSSVLTPVATGEGFEGSGSGSYGYTAEIVTSPATGCPNGAHSYMAQSGSADFVVHAHCTIDNPVTGGPDTSHYDRNTSVVEVLLEDHNLNLRRDGRDCEGRTESWTSQEGSVGFGCFFYGVDFDAAGSYIYRAEVTEGTYGTCTLNFNPPAPKGLRIFGKVNGQGGDSMVSFPIPNARVVATKFDQPRLKKLSESRPSFSRKTKTSDDEKATYEVELSLCDKPPKVVVVALLWHEGKTDTGVDPQFAITNGPAPAPGGPHIPVYQAICVDDDPQSHCHKWKQAGDGYEAEVNFEFGSEDRLNKQYTFMDSEEWSFSTSESALMVDAAFMYYNSWLAVKYFDGLGLGYPAEPVMMQSHYLEEDCGNGGEGAWYSQSAGSFGDLGQYLEKVGTPGGIFICSADSATGQADAPINREWHELAHYLLYRLYDPDIPCAGCKNHNGWANENSNDSYVEGFAEFAAAMVSKHYGNPEANIYPIGSHAINLEINFRTGPLKNHDEELAVAGILWDLFDPGREIGLSHNVNRVPIPISKVYPNPSDIVSLDEKRIFMNIKNGEPKTVVDLYNVFVASGDVTEVDADMIFLDHGFFADVVDRNYIHDSVAETIPESGHAPNRLRRESPPPTLPGSYIVFESGGTYEVSVTLSGDPTGQYAYSHTMRLESGVPAYFTMPPEYYPSKAVFKPITAEGKALAPVLEIDSEEYWDYIRSGPEKAGVFKTISAGRTD